MFKRKMLAASLTVLIAANGCASYRNYRQAQTAATAEDWDKAVLYYMRAAEKDPGNISYKSALLRAKVQASQGHFQKARKYYEAGVLERALVEYQQAVQLDPSNQSALVDLEKVREELIARRENRSTGGTLDEIKRRASDRSQPPTLSPRSKEPIDVDFPQPVSVMSIYQTLGRAFGINVMFDPNLKDQEIAVVLRKVTAQDALEYLMRAAGHFYKVLDEESIIIIADTPQNRRNYEDLVIQTFFLSNASVKEVVTMLRSLIDAKKLATNDQLNAIILRDTADKVKVAQKIIEANDKARAEVVVDVELLQINTSKLLDLGVTWPSRIESRLDVGGENVPLRLSDLEFLNQSNWTLTVPSFAYDFLKTSTDAQLLARPQLRISEGEKASLTIGDRIPVPVTSFNTANTVGSNVVPITSFQYQDVGIKINLEPRVHHNKEVTLKVTVEVSNLSGQVQSGGSSQPIIGTRNIDSTIRLKDGETNFLAGLIRTDETNSDSGLPGLSEIPIIGRLFSKNRNQNQRTDVILTLTPHIIRSADITEEDLLPIWVGTEANVTFRQGSPRVESDVEGPFDEGKSEEEIRELIQRRIQQLPPGLRDAAGAPEEQKEPEVPQGIDLVPGAPSVFNAPSQPEEPPLEDSGFGQPEIVEPEPPRFGGINSSSALRLATAAPQIVLVSDGPPAAELRFAPRHVVVAPDDEFEVAIRLDARQALSHLPLRLTYDPQRLAVLAVDRGAVFGSAGESEVIADVSRPGEIVLGASRMGDVNPISGVGVVAHLRLRALAPGQTQVRFAQAQALTKTLAPLAPVTVDALVVSIRDTDAPELPEHPTQDA